MTAPSKWCLIVYTLCESEHGNPSRKGGKTIDLYCYIKVLKVKPVYQQMTLSPKLGVVGISTLWHFRLPLPIQMFIKVASSPRLSGIGMPSPILWSHPLKMQRIVLLSSLLWWELGTNSLITGPGEWLSFRRFTSKLSWSWSWWNQLLLELSLDLINTLKICYRYVEDVH